MFLLRFVRPILNMATFIENHVFEIISFAVIVAGAIWRESAFRVQMEDLKEKVKVMETTGTTYTRERINQIQQQQAYIQDQVTEVAQDNKAINKTLNEMYTAVKVIESWVKSLNK